MPDGTTRPQCGPTRSRTKRVPPGSCGNRAPNVIFSANLPPLPLPGASHRVQLLDHFSRAQFRPLPADCRQVLFPDGLVPIALATSTHLNLTYVRAS